MILNVLMETGWRYAEAWDGMAAAIAEALGDAENDRRGDCNCVDDDHWEDCNRVVWFMFSDRRHRGHGDMPTNSLQVSVNLSTGYGGLIWCVSQGDPRRGGIYDYVWISDNEHPPDFDPRVISDAGYPLFHDRSSTLPISVVRAAVEEFCRTGTGERPECVRWVRGQVNGQREDRDPIVERVEAGDPFA